MSPSILPGSVAVDGVTITDTGGVLRAVPALAAGASGSSTSSTPGTLIAEIIAPAGGTLASFWVQAQAGPSNSDIRLVATLADSTTRTFDILAGQEFLVTPGGGKRPGQSAVSAWSADIDGPVTAIRAQTLNTGVSSRNVIIGAAVTP